MNDNQLNDIKIGDRVKCGFAIAGAYRGFAIVQHVDQESIKALIELEEGTVTNAQRMIEVYVKDLTKGDK